MVGPWPRPTKTDSNRSHTQNIQSSSTAPALGAARVPGDAADVHAAGTAAIDEVIKLWPTSSYLCLQRWVIAAASLPLT